MNICKKLSALLIAFILTSCATKQLINIDAARNTSFTGNNFRETLRKGYVNMSDEAASLNRKAEAERYGKKALVMLNGIDPEMETLYDRKISLTKMNDLLGARYFLEAAFVYEMKTKEPSSTAKAQLAFDCWVEEAERNTDPEKFQRCQTEFDIARQILSDKMANMRNQPPLGTYAPAPVVINNDEAILAPASPAMAPATAAPLAAKSAAHTRPVTIGRQSTIFFAEGSAELDYNASYAMSNAATDIEQLHPDRVIITGNAADGGNAQKNMELAQKRGEAVADILNKNFDVPKEIIDIKVYGDSNPKMTGKNPGGYVEIFLQKNSPFSGKAGSNGAGTGEGGE